MYPPYFKRAEVHDLSDHMLSTMLELVGLLIWKEFCYGLFE